MTLNFDVTARTNMLSILPNELVIAILEYLPTEDIVAVTRIDKHYHNLIQGYNASISAHITRRERSRLTEDLQLLDLTGLTPDDAFRRLSKSYPLPTRSWPIDPWRLTSARFASWYSTSNDSVVTYDEAVRLYCIIVSLNCRVLKAQHRISDIIPLDLLHDIDIAISNVASAEPSDLESCQKLSTLCNTYMPSLRSEDLESVVERIRSNPIAYASYEKSMEYQTRQQLSDFQASFQGSDQLRRAFELPTRNVPHSPNYGICSARGWKIMKSLMLDCANKKIRDGRGDAAWFWLWFGADLSGYFATVTGAWENIVQLLGSDSANPLRKAALLEEVCLC